MSDMTAGASPAQTSAPIPDDPFGPGEGTSLHALVRAWRFVPAEVAQVQLGCTRGDLLQMLNDGALDGVVVDARIYVLPDQLTHAVVEASQVRARTLETLLPALRYALAGYLATRPATGDYRVAVDEGRPLVCARRGSTHLEHGLHMHTVAAPVAAVAAWVGDEVARLQGGGPPVAVALTGPTAADRDDPHPSAGLSRLPAASALGELLVALNGVEEQHNVTPLHRRDGARNGAARVRGWVRIDPHYWAVRLGADDAREVGQRVDDAGYALDALSVPVITRWWHGGDR